MERKLLTIIISVYNGEKYLEECLNSLVNQTVQNHRVVIIDDGSKDSSAEICDRYVEMYPDLFTCVHQPNKGLGKARNVGISSVTTKYFTFLDADDWWDLDYVEEIEKNLNQFPSEEIDIIYTLPTIFDSLTGKYEDWHDRNLYLDIFYNGNRIVSIVDDARLYLLEYSACRKIFRTEFAESIGFKFEEDVKWEDVYPHFYATYHAKKCMAVKEVGFNYRINTDGQITSLSDSRRLDMVQAFAKIVHFMIEENIPEIERNIIFDQMFSFTKWCISSCDRTTRPMLVKDVAKLVDIIPKEYMESYKKRLVNKDDKMFFFMLRHRSVHKIYNDYLMKEKTKNILNKLRGVRRRV